MNEDYGAGGGSEYACRLKSIFFLEFFCHFNNFFLLIKYLTLTHPKVYFCYSCERVIFWRKREDYIYPLKNITLLNKYEYSSFFHS
jgi:hypothetical protein